MQPVERKRTKIQNGVARARMLLKRDAPWLPGYPIYKGQLEATPDSQIRWASSREFSQETPSVWVIDREALRRAQMTITKLRHHFPRALPKVVSNVDDWLARTDLLFDLLKVAVHGGRQPSAADVRQSGVLPERWTDELTQISSLYPMLTGFIDAVTFSALSDLQPAWEDQARWIQNHIRNLNLLFNSRPDIAFEMSLLLMSARDAISTGFVETLIDRLTEPALRQCNWRSMDRGVNQLAGALKKAVDQKEFSLAPLQGEQSLEDLVQTVCYRIASQRPKHQRPLFDLLEQLLTPRLTAKIIEAQRNIAENERRLQRLLRRVKSGREPIPRTKVERRTWLQDARRTQDMPPAQIAETKALGTALKQLIEGDSINASLWTRFLAAFPDTHKAMAIRLMVKWKYEGYSSDEHRKNIERVVQPLSSLLLRRGIRPNLLRNWAEYLDHNTSQYEFVDDTAYEVEGKTTLAKRTVSLLERSVYDQPADLEPGLLVSLVEFAVATSDEELACAIVQKLSHQPDCTCGVDAIRIAILFGNSPQEMAQIVMALKEADKTETLEKELRPLASDRKFRRIIANQIIEGRLSSLSGLTAAISILSDLRQPLPQISEISSPNDWTARYPEEFQAALQTLHDSTPDAEHIADNLLGNFFPTREALQRQIDALLAKIARIERPNEDQARMRRRVGNLRQRLRVGSHISPKRRNQLLKKLLRRADDENLNRLTLGCRVQIATALSDRFNISEFPEDLLHPPLDRVLQEMQRLKRPMRELGFRLLLESTQRTTQSFDNEPKNVAFIERMMLMGIDMRPWLSDEIRQHGKTFEGVDYELGFTRDATDFLLMGFHFDTCLSPDSFNFFSTVANAVDANKRVVYGKTAAGKVVGRCLFALNEQGEILTYYRYSHDRYDGFAEAVDRFATRLVGEMKTSIGSGGRVARLVASDWYDDGPMGANFRWLGNPGTVAELIKGVAPERLFTELASSVGGKVLRRHIVEVATDDQFRNRPHFLYALIDRYECEMSLREKFVIAVNVDVIELSDQLLSGLRWSDVVRFVRRHQCDECDVFHGIANYQRVFEVLNRYNPTLGLRAIRAARPRSIQSDLSDPNQTRRTALAHAHRLLGRQQLADQLINQR